MPSDQYVGNINIHGTGPSDISATHYTKPSYDTWWLSIGPVTVFAETSEKLLDIATAIMTKVLDIVPDTAISDDRLIDLVKERLVLA